jgi:pyruvate dehydrogenase E1 component beta subunit
MYGVSFDVSEAVLSPDFLLPLGKAKIQRPGKHCTIVTFSKMVGKSVEAAEILAKEGIEVEVIEINEFCKVLRL